MAKKKDRKNPKSKPGARLEENYSGTDDDGSVYNDGASVTSETSTIHGGDLEDGTNGVDESSKVEIFESKLKEALELATQKSAGGRVKALESICSAFQKRYCPDFIENQQMTTCDLVERSLKKGKANEAEAGAKLGSLLSLQLEDCEEVFKQLKPLLVQILLDKTASAASRAAVAQTLATTCFLGGGDIAEVVAIMASLETLISPAFTRPDQPAEISALQATAVSGWSLLLSLLSPGDAHRLANSNITKFSGLLRSSDVDLRITGGEAIALILEFAYQFDEEFLPDGLDSLIESLKQLATDSTKSRSKKDRKEQRSSFRDILRTVEDAEPPNEKVKFGQEVLYLDSWDRKLQYEWFAKVLGSGMNLHLTNNFVLREVFELGAPLPAFDPLSSNKMSKSERNAANQLAFKLRTQSRNKNRDKRSSVL